VINYLSVTAKQQFQVFGNNVLTKIFLPTRDNSGRGMEKYCIKGTSSM
jgi:hypothetical protein